METMTMTLRDLVARTEALHRDLGNTPCVMLDEPGLYMPAKFLYDRLRDFLQTVAVRDAAAAQGCIPERDVPHPKLVDPYSDQGIELLELHRRKADQRVAEEAAANPEPCWENPCCCYMPGCRA